MADLKSWTYLSDAKCDGWYFVVEGGGGGGCDGAHLDLGQCYLHDVKIVVVVVGMVETGRSIKS